MNRKQLIILIVAGLVIGVVAWRITESRAKNQQSSNQKLGQKVVPNFPINDVARIAIKQGNDQLTVAQKNDRWVVQERGDYPANFSTVSEVVRKVGDLKVAQTVRVGANQLGRLELLPPEKGTNSGTLVEFKDKNGKTITPLLLGKKHMREGRNDSPFGGGGGGWPDGRYVMVGNDPKSIAVVSEPFSNVEPKPADWLDKDFFKIEKQKSIAVTSQIASNSWKLAKESETNEWKLVDAKAGEQLDTGKSSSVTSAFSYPSFTDVATNKAPEQTGLDKPTTAKIETFDGFAYDIKVGKKVADDREDFFMQVAVNGNFQKERTPGKDEKPEDKAKLDKEHKDKIDKLEEKLKAEKALADWVYIVPKYTLDPLFKERKDLLVEKKEEPKKEESKAGETKKEDTKLELPKSQETVKVNAPKPAPPPPLPTAEKPAAPDKTEIKN